MRARRGGSEEQEAPANTHEGGCVPLPPSGSRTKDFDLPRLVEVARAHVTQPGEDGLVSFWPSLPPLLGLSVCSVQQGIIHGDTRKSTSEEKIETLFVRQAKL